MTSRVHREKGAEPLGGQGCGRDAGGLPGWIRRLTTAEAGLAGWQAAGRLCCPVREKVGCAETCSEEPDKVKQIGSVVTCYAAAESCTRSGCSATGGPCTASRAGVGMSTGTCSGPSGEGCGAVVLWCCGTTVLWELEYLWHGTGKIQSTMPRQRRASLPRRMAGSSSVVGGE